MAKLSAQPPISDVTGTELFPVVVTPDSPTDPHVINATALAYSSALFAAFKDHLEATLAAGSGVAPLSIDPATGLMTITATGAGGAGWDAEQTRDTIGAALTGVSGHTTITPNDAGDLIVADLDPAFVAMIDAMKAARSLVQIKENSASGGAGNFMVLPGGSGNHIDAPSASAFNVAGDLTVIARIKMPASAPGAAFTVASRWGATTAAGQWRFVISTAGQMSLTITVDGVGTSTATTTAVTPLAFDGNYIWVRFTRTASTGSTNFFTAADTGSNVILPTSYPSFQSNRSTTAGALSATSGAPLAVGSYNAGASSIFTGSMGRVVVFNGNSAVSSPVIADANAADYSTGTTWAGPAGNTWTLHGTASITLVGGGATSNTATKFVLADTDANAAIALSHRDVVYWSARGGLFNTVGTSRTFTFELVVNNVVLSTFDPITVASTAASTVYRWECSLNIEINSADGSTQDYQWTLRIYDAKTGTFLGSSSTSAVIVDVGSGNALALSTYLSLPKIELKLTMSATASASVGAGMAHSRVSLQKAA